MLPLNLVPGPRPAQVRDGDATWVFKSSAAGSQAAPQGPQLAVFYGNPVFRPEPPQHIRNGAMCYIYALR